MTNIYKARSHSSDTNSSTPPRNVANVKPTSASLFLLDHDLHEPSTKRASPATTVCTEVALASTNSLNTNVKPMSSTSSLRRLSSMANLRPKIEDDSAHSPAPSLKYSCSSSPSSSICLPFQFEDSSIPHLVQPASRASSCPSPDSSRDSSAETLPEDGSLRSSSFPTTSDAITDSSKMSKSFWSFNWSNPQNKSLHLLSATPHTQSPLSNELTAADIINSASQHESSSSFGPLDTSQIQNDGKPIPDNQSTDGATESASEGAIAIKSTDSDSKSGSVEVEYRRASWWTWNKSPVVTDAPTTSTTSTTTTMTTMTTTTTTTTTTITAPIVQTPASAIGENPRISPVTDPLKESATPPTEPLKQSSTSVSFWGLPWFRTPQIIENEKPETPSKLTINATASKDDLNDTPTTPKRVVSSSNISPRPERRRKFSLNNTGNPKTPPPTPTTAIAMAKPKSDSAPASDGEQEVTSTDISTPNNNVDKIDKASLSSSPQRKGSTFWAFWSQKDTDDHSQTKTEEEQNGEMAISGTPSETHPVKSKGPPEYMIESETPQPPPPLSSPDSNDKRNDPQKRKSSKSSPKKSSAPPRVHRPNLVLPPLEDNFPVYSNSQKLRNSWRRITSWWGGGSNSIQIPQKQLWSDPTATSTQHLYRTSPHVVKKVVVIGVHGFFPMRMLRSIIGEPTGTSMKFANEAALAFEQWAKKTGIEIEIEKIALEGEGKVFSRVDGLYKLLMNWSEHIEEADCVFFAAHSQGTPVAAHLLARLVAEGHVENKKIGLIGMAGISLGPFSGLDQNLMVRAYSSIESSSLTELFQFQEISSLHSRKYIESLRTIIASNAKIVFVGSINDQLVPLYSSTCVHVSHPNILRAVYVDGGTEVAPEFISNLVSLALRLKNLGSTDHGLIKEISGSLAGSLRGGGHSKIYDEPAVYELAIRHVLETTDADPTLPVFVDTDFQVPPKQNHNPYLLPWSLHGLFTEASARPQLKPLLHDLVQEFSEWAPESKVLKEIKYRLSAVQSKL